MGKEIKKGLIYAIITIAISITTSIYTTRGEIINKKADKEELKRVERQSKERDDKIENRFDHMEKGFKDFEKEIDSKLDDHQKQIVSNNKEMYQEIIKLIKNN